MTDYAEERASELEVLESIYPEELTVIADDKLSIRVEQDPPHPTNPYTLLLTITYSPTYPDELPEIEVEGIEGDLTEEEEQELVQSCITAVRLSLFAPSPIHGLLTSFSLQGNESLGMAMVYTLSLHLREALTEVLEARKVRIAKEEAEKERLEEEAQAKRTAGTKVTRESFLEWKEKFDKEMLEKEKKEEAERLKGLPPKEREETKKFLSKLTGRQLFERDLQGTLIASDVDLDEEGAVSVDASQYERTGQISDDEDEERHHLGEISDDD
ncbi:RWD-domain-containing protein [Meredithblackwellia eburnea MCA 4105]